MPSMYAHHCFGGLVLSLLPREVQGTIQQCRDEYEIGLQGPDIFFYQDPLGWGRIPQYGNALHKKSGREFFSDALEQYFKWYIEENEEESKNLTKQGKEYLTKNKEAEQSAVYLYGVVCHFCLDSTCHPVINDIDAAHIATHAELEGDFDRYLIAKEGRDPVKEELTEGFHPGKEVACAIASVYREVSQKEVLQSLHRCVFLQKLVRCPNDGKRNFLYWVLRKIGKYSSFHSHIMNEEPDPACCDAEKTLDHLLHEAVPKGVRLVEEMDELLCNVAKEKKDAISYHEMVQKLLSSCDYDVNFAGIRP